MLFVMCLIVRPVVSSRSNCLFKIKSVLVNHVHFMQICFFMWIGHWKVTYLRIYLVIFKDCHPHLITCKKLALSNGISTEEPVGYLPLLAFGHRRNNTAAIRRRVLMMPDQDALWRERREARLQVSKFLRDIGSDYLAASKLLYFYVSFYIFRFF